MMDIPELPNPQRRAVEIVREVALEKGVRPYLVGGPVRDLLLGRQAFDIDLTVEDDSSILAKALAKRLGARVKSFPQFLTYKVLAEDLPEIDIATARKERYRHPGALPSVAPGKLKDDLLRRDFSVNALALQLIAGTLHDPTGGEADLRGRTIRVLHDSSFTDDPTRIFRAIRLATRLDFTLEEKTASLMRDAISGGALATISRERVWRELFLAMDEADAPAVLRELASHGAVELLFGRRDLHLGQLETMGSLIEAAPDLDRYVLFTSALLHGDASPIELEGSGFSQKRARTVMQIANELPRFSDALAEAKSERQRFRILKSASAEMLALLSRNESGGRGDVARYQDFQSFRLPLRGSELEVPAGPHVARALERTREALFTGEIAPDEARSFAQQMAIKYLSRETPARQK